MLSQSFSSFFNAAALTQKTVLAEGGNLKIETKEGQTVFADRIDLTVVSRKKLAKNLLEFFHQLNSKFEAKFGFKLWSNPSILDSGHAFNGSSEHFFNSSITDDEFSKYKSKVGDIDITVPESQKDNLHELLNTLEGKQITTSSKLLGCKQDTVGEGHQLNCLVNIDGKINVQIDFEFSDYEEDLPSKFAKFSHSSDWEDIKAGYKGVLHKYLLQSIASISDVKTEEQAILLTPASSFDKIKVSKTFPDRGLTFKKFSVGRGLRTDAYSTVSDETGNPLQIDGKTAYKVRPPLESTYIKDPEQIAKTIFGPKFNSTELTKLNSFIGIIDLCNKYFSNKEKNELMLDFIRRLFGQGSQGLERDNPKGDYDIKKAGYLKLKQELGVTGFSDLPDSYEELMQTSEKESTAFQSTVKVYYNIYGNRSRNAK
jgi:hypothetical protein